MATIHLNYINKVAEINGLDTKEIFDDSFLTFALDYADQKRIRAEEALEWVEKNRHNLIDKYFTSNRYKGQQELSFASEDSAFKFFADLTGKRLKIAASDNLKDFVEEYVESRGVMDMLPGEIKDVEVELRNDDISFHVKTTTGVEFSIKAKVTGIEEG